MRSNGVVLVGVLASVLPGAAARAEPVSTAVWLTTYPAALGSGDVAAFPDGTAYAWNTGPSDGQQNVRSSDFGVHWSAQPAVPGWTPRMGTPTVGFSVSAYSCTSNACDRSVFRTGDGGRSWQKATPLLDAGSKVRQTASFGYAVAPGGRTVVVPVTRQPRSLICPSGVTWEKQADILVSHDGARTWRQTHLPVRGGVSWVSMYDDRHGVLAMTEASVSVPEACYNMGATYRSAVWVTDDGGMHWRRAAVTCVASCQSVAMPAPDRVVVGAHDGVVQVSTDGGRTFRTTRLTPAGADVSAGQMGLPVVADFAFSSPYDGFAITTGGGIWRTADGGLVWTLEPSPDHVFLFGGHQIAAADATHGVAIWPGGVLTRVGLAN